MKKIMTISGTNYNETLDVKYLEYPKCNETNKYRYPTKQLALGRIKLYKFLNKKRKKTYNPERAYYCNDCHGWHLTSQKNSSDKKKYNRKIKQKQFFNSFDIENWKKDSLPFPENNQ